MVAFRAVPLSPLVGTTELDKITGKTALMCVSGDCRRNQSMRGYYQARAHYSTYLEGRHEGSGCQFDIYYQAHVAGLFLGKGRF